jgi:hypothetical protein
MISMMQKLFSVQYERLLVLCGDIVSREVAPPVEETQTPVEGKGKSFIDFADSVGRSELRKLNPSIHIFNVDKKPEKCVWFLQLV